MTITTADQVEKGLNSNFSRYFMTKAAPDASATIAGTFTSYWRGAGTGGVVGAVPAGATTLNNLSVGAVPFRQQVAPAKSYLANLNLATTVAPSTLEIHDRLMHVGVFSGAINTAQTVTGFDMSLFLATDNLAERKGDTNYSDVQWWAEFYVDNSITTQSAVIGVTYNDGTSGTLTGVTTMGRRPGRLVPLNSYIPAADAGKYIRAITQVTLSATGGTAGSFGFTATRYRAGKYIPSITEGVSSGWTDTGLPEIYNGSCLFPILINSATTAITNARIDAQIIHG